MNDTNEKSAIPSQPSTAGVNAPQSPESISNNPSSVDSATNPLLGATLQVPGFTRANVFEVCGEWAGLYALVNGKPMTLYRRLEYVYGLAGLPFNAVDTQEFDPVVIDDEVARSTAVKCTRCDGYGMIASFSGSQMAYEPEDCPDCGSEGVIYSLDPVVIDEPPVEDGDTEIIPLPDVEEFETLEGLNVPPWAVAGDADFSEPTDAYINGAKLNALEVTLKKNSKGVWSIQLINATDEQRKQAMEAVTNAVVFEQSVGKWLDDRFIPYAVTDSETGYPRTLTLIERLEESERWLKEELAAARDQLEVMRSESRKTAPKSSAGDEKVFSLTAHQTGLIYGDEVA